MPQNNLAAIYAIDAKPELMTIRLANGIDVMLFINEGSLEICANRATKEAPKIVGVSVQEDDANQHGNCKIVLNYQAPSS